ncbi:hypothetical protein O181_095498 [Austropuccinia psidii MF-1]|uniref:Uncharacterized protein n=1 Tax=Austropuccinia psidii MF-1 TaxID=1389203 RepID=A0A9Q3PB99_9BASI|nr:hypothetical protein [Austropuccinia psidii MF-1]
MPPTRPSHQPNHQHHLPSLRSCSTLTTPYASEPPPHLLCFLQSLRSHGSLMICLRCRPQPPLHLLPPA